MKRTDILTAKEIEVLREQKRRGEIKLLYVSETLLPFYYNTITGEKTMVGNGPDPLNMETNQS